MRTIASLLGATLLALGSVGCGDIANDRLQTICDCENCGDRELEEVEIIVATDLEIAEAYNCVEVLEPYWECQLDRHECDDGRYSDDHDECESEHEQYEECLDAQSTRNGGPYNKH